MEIKGRVKAINGPSERMKKDQSGTYVITDVDVQIGVYNRTKADYITNTFNTVQEPEMIRKSYFGDDAASVKTLLNEGDVVNVKLHHYINQYGRIETVIDSILPINAKEKALNQASTPAPAPQPVQQKQPGDDLPF